MPTAEQSNISAETPVGRGRGGGGVMLRLLTSVASVWEKLARHQVPIILAAGALGAVLLQLKPSDPGSVRASAWAAPGVFVTVVALWLAVRFLAGKNASLAFALALLLRLGAATALETTSTPDSVSVERAAMAEPWLAIPHESMLYYPDEIKYIYYARRYQDWSFDELVTMHQIESHGRRASFLMSYYVALLGEELVWGRIIGALCGAIIAALLATAAGRILSPRGAAAAALVAVAGPQMVMLSVVFLKEIWIMLAVALLAYGYLALRQTRRRIGPIVCILVGAPLLCWVRLEIGLVILFGFPVSLFFSRKMRMPVRIAVLLLIVPAGIIAFRTYGERLTEKRRSLTALFAYEKRIESRIPFLDRVYAARGALRLLNAPLVLINPTPRQAHKVFVAGEYHIYDVMKQSVTYQWWPALPFLLVGAATVIRGRRELLVILLPYALWTVAAAVMAGGLHVEAARYRDSLLPIGILLIGLGVDEYLKGPARWARRVVQLTYGLALMLVCLYVVRDLI